MSPKELLFCYAGSKWRMAKRYNRLYPPHKHFVDVFGGTGAVIARKPKSRYETYNDRDKAVYNVFSVIQDEAQRLELIRLLENTPNSVEQYAVCKRIALDPAESDARRAWAFLVRGAVGFSGHPLIANSWTSIHKQRRRLLTLPDIVLGWRERFRWVALENRPWQEMLDRYDSPSTFFFCDPSYLPETLRCPVDHYYVHTLSREEHIELIERLRTIQGYALLCGYNHPAYTTRLFHWRKVSFQARSCMGATKREKRQEQVWMNYEDDGSRIEGNRLRIARRYIDIMGGEEEAIRYLERVAQLRRLPK
jgi:DNA adenine methylase